MLRVDLQTANSVFDDFNSAKASYLRNTIFRIECNNKVFAEYAAEVCAYAVPENCEDERMGDILRAASVGVCVVYDALARTFAQEKRVLPKVTQGTIDSLIRSWREDGSTEFTEILDAVMLKVKTENPILANLLSNLVKRSSEEIFGSSLAMTGAVTYALISRQFESNRWDKLFGT